MADREPERETNSHPGRASIRARGRAATFLVGLLGAAGLFAGCRTVSDEGLPLGQNQPTGDPDAGATASEPPMEAGPREARPDAAPTAESPSSTDSCMPGQRFCAGNIPQICGADGNWILGEPCAYACQDGCANRFAAVSSGRGSPTDGSGRAEFVFNDQTLFSEGGGLLGARGFNVAVLDPNTGRVLEPARTFDPWVTRLSGRALEQLAEYLEALEPGRLLLMAVSDDAGLTEVGSCQLRDLAAVRRVLAALEKLGSTQMGSYCFRGAWAFVTVTGQFPPLAERLSAGPKVTAEVLLPADR